MIQSKKPQNNIRAALDLDFSGSSNSEFAAPPTSTSYKNTRNIKCRLNRKNQGCTFTRQVSVAAYATDASANVEVPIAYA